MAFDEYFLGVDGQKWEEKNLVKKFQRQNIGKIGFLRVKKIKNIFWSNFFLKGKHREKSTFLH